MAQNSTVNNHNHVCTGLHLLDAQSVRCKLYRYLIIKVHNNKSDTINFTKLHKKYILYIELRLTLKASSVERENKTSN
jgi:hypothetical protein